jgi:hypothetical protein
VNIDLHIHSTASDGTLTPAEIIARARQLGLAAIAITDHDTVAGATQALAAGLPSDLHFITGVEISTESPRRFPCRGSLHLLGYGFNPDDIHLMQALKRLQNARQDRNPRIIAKLNRLDIPISMAHLEAEAGNAQIGRPHIANWLVKHGVVPSFDEAFERYLGVGRPAYADKYRIDCEAAITLIRNAGGVPVLAHPALIAPRGSWPRESLILELKTCGLMGIEAYYPEHTPAQTQTYLQWAKRYGLAVTGGTDFHGAIKADIEMGRGSGDFQIPFRCYTQLAALIEKASSTLDATRVHPGRSA